MMTAKEIAAILIAFDEGKRVVFVKPEFSYDQSFDVRHGIKGLMNSVLNGAHFAVKQEPVSIWMPQINGKVYPVNSHFTSSAECDIAWSDENDYTGAIQFKEVIEP